MRTKAGVSILLALATFLLYAPVREHRFVDLDDYSAIEANPDLRVASASDALTTAVRATLNANWIPVTVLSLQIDRALWGDEPAGFHLTNVALHAACSIVLFLALLRLTGAAGRSAFVAAVFALHPLHVESVAWAAMRKDSLSGLFWMLAMWSYAGYARRPGARGWTAVTLFLALGLLSKPAVVTLPFVLLLLDYWPLGRLGRAGEARRAVLEKLPWFALVAGASAVTLWVQARAGALPDVVRLPFELRLWNAIDSYGAYLLESFWPAGLAVFHPHPIDALPAARVALIAALLASLSLATVWLARSRPYLLVGWLWYLGTLVPMIGLVQAGMQARADRYMYLPLIGLALAVSWGVADPLGRSRTGRALRATAFTAALVALVGAASAQLRHWRDPVALHQRVVAVTRPYALSEQRLANALRVAGRLEEAAVHYERAVALAPERGAPYIGLADLHARAGRLERAVTLYEQGLTREPGHARGHGNLGLALYRLERFEEARPHLERAIASAKQARSSVGLTPAELASPHMALADVLSYMGELDAAIAHYERALALDGTRARAGGNLGIALARAGRFEEARPLLEQALAWQRYSAELQAGMARTYAGLGRPRDAIRHFDNALLLRPGWRHAANDLAWILATSSDAELRDPQRAVRLMEEVILPEEFRASLVDTLAAAYAAAGRYDDAVAAADRALTLCRREPELAAAIRERRALYLAGKPYVAAATPHPEPGERSTARGPAG